MKDYKYYAGVNAFSTDQGRGYVEWSGDAYSGDKTSTESQPGRIQ